MLDFVFYGSELTDSRKRTKLNGLWFTRQNFQHIECSSVKYKRGRLHLQRTQIPRTKAPSKDPWRCKISPTTIIKRKFTTNNRTKRCVPSDSRISPSVSGPSKSLRHAMDQERTFCFDVMISATIFARRKSAGGNMIGLNQQRKSHASSRSFGGWVRAHFPEQRLVIEPNYCMAQ